MKIETVTKFEGVRLCAPAGTSSINHEGAEFKVEDDGSIVVPVSAVPMLGVHGFTAFVPKPVEAAQANGTAGSETGGAGDAGAEANTSAAAAKKKAPWATGPKA